MREEFNEAIRILEARIQEIRLKNQDLDLEISKLDVQIENKRIDRAELQDELVSCADAITELRGENSVAPKG